MIWNVHNIHISLGNISSRIFNMGNPKILQRYGMLLPYVRMIYVPMDVQLYSPSSYLLQ